MIEIWWSLPRTSRRFGNRTSSRTDPRSLTRKGRCWRLDEELGPEEGLIAAVSDVSGIAAEYDSSPLSRRGYERTFAYKQLCM